MGVLIKNEFYKLKREWFLVFLLLLSLLPILTGGAGAVFNTSFNSKPDCQIEEQGNTSGQSASSIEYRYQ